MKTNEPRTCTECHIKRNVPKDGYLWLCSFVECYALLCNHCYLTHIAMHELAGQCERPSRMSLLEKQELA